MGRAFAEPGPGTCVIVIGVLRAAHARELYRCYVIVRTGMEFEFENDRNSPSESRLEPASQLAVVIIAAVGQVWNSYDS
jgi:hypothetical protein